MEGQILGNRYELLKKIGGGGMALVYKAKCQLLNRFVAVKILRPEFTNDDEFVKRFKIEAQSAASLSHPNIVSIYDVGHEGSIHYIIMEYIDGITLKDYIIQKGALNWKEAIDITVQICSAIEHAHRNHIVHRDIKPHNIMITNEHIAKVTDFGIARAVSSSTITMVGSTIGSVHYFSPEQARGGYTDEKSDLYSIGITLYEMVTGRLPFDGETPVAIALKHIQVEPQAPIEINTNLPKGVNDIIIKAIKKEQNKRYQNAAEMLNDLYKVMKAPDSEFVTNEDEKDFPTRRVKAISNNELSEDANNSEKKKVARKKDRLPYWIAGFVAFIIIISLSYVSFRLAVNNPQNSNSDFEVGNYIDRNINDVKTELAKDKIYVKETRKYSKDILKDVVISQEFDPKKPLKRGSFIELVVSDGPQMVKLTDLRNLNWADAQLQIKDMGLVPVIIEENSDTIAEGQVIKTDPGVNQDLVQGDPVNVYKSIGRKIVNTNVPNVVGMTEKDAKDAIIGAGLKLGKIFPEDQSNFVDKVVSSYPSYNVVVPKDSAVDIYLEQQNTSIEKDFTINLTDPENYSDVIKVLVEITPSDTGKVETILNVMKDKNEFPVTVSVTIPEGGSTNVRVFLDNKQYGQDYTIN